MSSDANLNNVTLEQIVSLCKRRGFVYQSAEIYSGLNGVYDFGPLGTQLKQNIKNAWTKALLLNPDNQEAKRGMAALNAKK